MMATTARFLAFVALVSAALAGEAAGQSLRLGYEAYAGGLHVMSFGIRIEETGGDYQVATDVRTRGLADFLVGMHLDSHAFGKVRHGDFVPSRYLSQARFGRRSSSLLVEPAQDGGFFVQATPPRESDERRTPVPAASLSGAVDPLTAMLRASRTVATSGTCRQRVPVFDGRRRYDLVFADEGVHPLAATRYSSYAGPARLCRVRQERIGGFLAEEDGEDIGQESLLWIASPLSDGPPVPVRVEVDTGWGGLTIHLDEVTSESGTVRLARRPGVD